jgi:hypothetical protein
VVSVLLPSVFGSAFILGAPIRPGHATRPNPLRRPSRAKRFQAIPIEASMKFSRSSFRSRSCPWTAKLAYWKCPSVGARFTHMRNLWLCVLLLGRGSFASECDDHSLKSLYESHPLFELREAVNKGGASIFYQGIVACAFNDLLQCKKKLESVIKSTPNSTDGRQARITYHARRCVLPKRTLPQRRSHLVRFSLQ